MAEIPIERKKKSGLGWLPLALLALIAVAALLLRNRDRDPQVATAPAATTTAAGGEVAGGSEMLPVATILGGPEQYANQPVSGNARVTEVVSDRGFWVEENGQRMFVLLGEKGAGTNAAEHHTDIKAGQTLRLSGHVFTSADQVPGGNVEAEARQAIQGQRAFLHVMPQDVQQVAQR